MQIGSKVRLKRDLPLHMRDYVGVTLQAGTEGVITNTDPGVSLGLVIVKFSIISAIVFVDIERLEEI